MNRRAFFGFACGGVAAAPLALVGEKAHASHEATTAVTVGIQMVDVDGNLKTYVNDAVRKAVDHQRRSLPFEIDYLRATRG